MSRPEYGQRRIPRSTVARILAAQDGRCRYCGRPLPLAEATAEHVVARSKGGSDDPSNVVVACGSCNSRKGAGEPPAGVVGSIGPSPKPRDTMGEARALGDVTLAEAGELLGRSPTTLRHQAAAGRFRAKLVGKTWITTRAEVERYRRDSLGKPGRPPADDVDEPPRSGHTKWSEIKRMKGVPPTTE